MQLVANVDMDMNTTPQGQKKSLSYMMSKRPSPYMLFSAECILIQRKKCDLGLTHVGPKYPFGIILFAFYLFKFSTKILKGNCKEYGFGCYFTDI